MRPILAFSRTSKSTSSPIWVPPLLKCRYWRCRLHVLIIGSPIKQTPNQTCPHTRERSDWDPAVSSDTLDMRFRSGDSPELEHFNATIPSCSATIRDMRDRRVLKTRSPQPKGHADRTILFQRKRSFSKLTVCTQRRRVRFSWNGTFRGWPNMETG